MRRRGATSERSESKNLRRHPNTHHSTPFPQPHIFTMVLVHALVLHLAVAMGIAAPVPAKAISYSLSKLWISHVLMCIADLDLATRLLDQAKEYRAEARSDLREEHERTSAADDRTKEAEAQVKVLEERVRVLERRPAESSSKARTKAQGPAWGNGSKRQGGGDLRLVHRELDGCSRLLRSIALETIFLVDGSSARALAHSRSC